MNALGLQCLAKFSFLQLGIARDAMGFAEPPEIGDRLLAEAAFSEQGFGIHPPWMRWRLRFKTNPG